MNFMVLPMTSVKQPPPGVGRRIPGKCPPWFRGWEEADPGAEKILETQTQEIGYNMVQLVHCFGDQLSSVVSRIQKGSVGGTPTQASYYAFLLKKMAKLLDGEYL